MEIYLSALTILAVWTLASFVHVLVNYYPSGEKVGWKRFFNIFMSIPFAFFGFLILGIWSFFDPVFNRRAIPRAHTLNDDGEHRAVVEAEANDTE